MKQNGGVVNLFLGFSLFENNKKSVPRGENHLKSNHVESFSASQGVLKGQVHASMKKKVCNVMASDNIQ